jgi:bifunctional non-homologous end joining protein LigD
MRDDPRSRTRKARHNWLLVKERDEAAHPGDPEALAVEDTSVTSGRTLDEIASSKKSRVWNSNRNGSGSGNGAAARPKTAAGLKKKPRSATLAKRTQKNPH